MQAAQKYIPFDTPLNSYQMGLIQTPYNEWGITCGLAYIADPETRGAERLFSPYHAFTGNLDHVPTAEQLARYARSEARFQTRRELLGDNYDDDEEYYTPPTAGSYNAASYACSSIFGLATAPVAGLAVGIPVSVGSFGIGAALGLVLFEGVCICINIDRIRSSPHYLAWKQQRIELMTERAVADFFQWDDILTHLLCPITGKIPLVPAIDSSTLTPESITYDFHAAIKWIREKPDTPLPGSTSLTTERALSFDFGHINAIIDRLGSVREHIEKEQNRIMREVAATFVPEGLVDLNNDVMRVMSQNGYMNLEEGFGNNPSLNFIGRLLPRCGDAKNIGIDARLRFFKKTTEPLLLAMASGIEAGRLLEMVVAFNDKYRVIKRIKINDYDPISTFFRYIFGASYVYHSTERSFDERITGLDVRKMHETPLPPPLSIRPGAPFNSWESAT